jgi:arsenate reductase
MTTTIYHNPACGTSRKALALIAASGVTPEIVEYLAHPPSRARLEQLIAGAGLSVRAARREKESLYTELGLDQVTLSDAQLLDAMLAHPRLINRPFVATPLGIRLCRPAEVVLEILPAAV